MLTRCQNRTSATQDTCACTCFDNPGCVCWLSTNIDHARNKHLMTAPISLLLPNGVGAAPERPPRELAEAPRSRRLSAWRLLLAVPTADSESAWRTLRRGMHTVAKVLFLASRYTTNPENLGKNGDRKPETEPPTNPKTE